MNNMILNSMLSMAGLGLFFASILAFANQKFKVKEDPKVEAIEGALPGVNCGACGFTSCRQYAESLAKGECAPDLCKAGGEEVIGKLSGILGVELEAKAKESAVVHCGADDSKRKKKAIYLGIKTCAAAHALQGGELLCTYGCLGYGDCKKACPFGAIEIIKGLARVNIDKCTACGKCVAACPRKLITLEETGAENFVYVACSNRDKGADTRKACSVGCIACGLCQKLTGGIFYVENMLAGTRKEKLKELANREEAISKCPTKCIRKLD